jgi:hypothetical protein
MKAEPTAVDPAARICVRKCRTVITAPRRSLMTGWRLVMVAAIDEIAADYRGIDEYYIEPCSDGLRLIVESLAGYDAADIARAVKLRALRRCQS